MGMRIKPKNHKSARGFVIGELLIALVLLAVAVSSLAALMYSVSRRPTVERESLDPQCVASAAASGKCIPKVKEAAASSKLLRSGCATRSVFDQRDCKDSLVSSAARDTAVETVLKPRTDSASMAMLAKKPKPPRNVERADRGFVR